MQLNKITCMMKDCPFELTEANIKEIFTRMPDHMQSTNLFNKMKRFQAENKIVKDKNLKLCPIPDCGGYAELSKKKAGKSLTCNNNHEFCEKCLNLAHPNKACEEVLDEFFKNWRTGKLIKRCPNCKFWTEKNEGCNHMTCRGCQYQWCWICSSKYSSLHYNIGFCYGLQFSNYYILIIYLFIKKI